MGEYEVTADHVPIVAELKAGMLTIKHGDGEDEKYFVPGGFSLTHEGSTTVSCYFFGEIFANANNIYNMCGFMNYHIAVGRRHDISYVWWCFSSLVINSQVIVCGCGCFVILVCFCARVVSPNWAEIK